MNRKRLNLIKVILGVGLIILLYYKIGFNNIVKEISKMNLLFLPLILVILFLIFLIATINISFFTRALGYSIPLNKLFRFYLLSWTSGLLIPGKLGEFALVPLLNSEKVGLGEGLSIALLDKLITAFTLGIISLTGLLFIFNLPQAPLLVLAIICGLGMPMILISSDQARKFVRKHILRKYEKRFKGFSKTFFQLLKSKVAIFNIALTFVKWVLSALGLWLLFLSLGARVEILQIFFINSVAMIVSLIPITISGLGIREITAIYLYSRVGVGTAIVAAVYLLIISLNYIIGSITFFTVGIRKRD